MNIFFNISHPAHVHFFKNAIKILSQRGHNIIVGARDKDITIGLLKAYDIKHIFLTKKGNGLAGLGRELLEQQIKLSSVVKNNSIDLMLQINGIFNAPVGRFFGIPTIAFSDTENDKWINYLSFSLSRHVISPSCFDHTIGGSWKNQIHYPGYHELSYLSPNHLPKRIKPENKFLVRFVGWGAVHDIGETGLSINQKMELLHLLKNFGSVYISSEAPLPEEISEFACSIPPSEIHDFMMTCKIVVGESATMASEAACLGIPALFISNTGRGYTTEQDQKYGLIKHYRLDQWKEIIERLKLWATQDLRNEWKQKRMNMLKDKIDVTSWLVDLIENYPDSIGDAEKGNFERYLLRCAE